MNIELLTSKYAKIVALQESFKNDFESYLGSAPIVKMIMKEFEEAELLYREQAENVLRGCLLLKINQEGRQRNNAEKR